MSNIINLINDVKNTPEYWEELTQLEYATFLNEEIEKQGITQQQLANTLGVSKAYISKVLSGEKINFTIKSMAKIMYALGKHLCFLSEPLKSTPSNINELMFMLSPEQDKEKFFSLGAMKKISPKEVLEKGFAA